MKIMEVSYLVTKLYSDHGKEVLDCGMWLCFEISELKIICKI